MSFHGSSLSRAIPKLRCPMAPHSAARRSSLLRVGAGWRKLYRSKPVAPDRAGELSPSAEWSLDMYLESRESRVGACQSVGTT